MSGAGLFGGDPTEQLIGIRPGDESYVAHTGAVFHPQDENNTDANVAFYEIQNTGDTIDFDLTVALFGYDAPILQLRTAWGATDFDVIERSTDQTLTSELSGFSTDTWLIDLGATDGKLRITNFDTGTVTGTEAGWLAWLSVYDRV